MSGFPSTHSNAGSYSEVLLLRWPDDEPRRQQLAIERTPRLLLLDATVDPPTDVDDLEDWIRVPAEQRDIDARVATLDRRARRDNAAPPVVDDGVVRAHGMSVTVPPVEARLVAALVAGFGSVVSRQTLEAAGWPERTRGRNALDVHVLRLRRRLQPLGLVIRNVRNRGYVLQHP